MRVWQAGLPDRALPGGHANKRLAERDDRVMSPTAE